MDTSEFLTCFSLNNESAESLEVHKILKSRKVEEQNNLLCQEMMINRKSMTNILINSEDRNPINDI